MTKHFVLLGNPVSQSISPAFWNETFNRTGIDADYIALKVEKDNIYNILNNLDEMGFSGANITIPYKTHGFKVCSKVHYAAQRTGVVNTLIKKGSITEGWNTDYTGLKNLAASIGKDARILVIGAGATAATTLNVFSDLGCKQVMQIARHFYPNITTSLQKLNIIKFSWNYKNFVYTIKESDIIVNATPLGWKPEDDIPGFADGMSSDKFFLDFNYSSVSRLIKSAEDKKCKIINGLEILLRQALDAFRVFINEDPPEQIMRSAVYNNFAH